MLKEDEKFDILMEKYASDKKEYEEEIERLKDEDYQRWLSMIRPEYMKKYLTENIGKFLQDNLKVKFFANENLIDVSVYVGDRIITSDTLDLYQTLGPVIDAAN